MAEKKVTPEGAPRRKREAPTIDLTAKDVTPPSATPEPPAADAPASEPEPVQTAASEPPIEPPPLEPPQATDSTPEEKPVTPAAPHVPWGSLIAASLVGGVIVAGVLGGLWYGDMLPVRSVASSTDNGDRLAALQKQVEALQSRPAVAGDSKAVDALSQRVGKMEDALKNLPKGDGNVTDRLTAAENAMKSLGVALTALNQRSDDATANATRAREQAEAAEKAIAQLRGSVQDAAKDASSAVTPAQIDALTQRLASLEQASKSARADLDKTVAGEKATRLALSAGALRAAVTAGTPFSAELAQAKALGAPDKYLSALAPFAASGVPGAAALAQELRALLPQMVKTSGATPSGSFLDRLQANASKLVRVTPVDAPPGDDVSAVLARLEVEAAHADIAGAVADLNKLPEQTRAPAQAWLAKAKAREAALAASRDLAADTARALGSR